MNDDIWIADISRRDEVIERYRKALAPLYEHRNKVWKDEVERSNRYCCSPRGEILRDIQRHINDVIGFCVDELSCIPHGSYLIKHPVSEDQAREVLECLRQAPAD